MREFILKILLVKKLVGSLLDDVKLKELIDGWSFAWIFIQHQRQEVWNVLAKMRWNIRVLALDDLLSKLMQTLSVEWRL